MADELTARGTGKVFDEHVQQGAHGTVDEDLERNYASDVVVLTGAGAHRGHEGVRELAELLRGQLPQAEFTYTARVFAGEVALLEWTAQAANGGRVEDGADSFLIRNGRIQAQTIHYTVLPGSRQDKDRN
ncbi:nuclear transport factor 2 family protein [Janibacter massiliensis]|uniref:nuclear transport factor 2 family protein n=1 Tax=Janibacter massiliensis TaxID=2058291 RepID=UPI000D107069|nr:nuclear transport factor 2 family protein [Janibacter massiliensis]